MFPLHPHLARLLTGERIADAHRRADHYRRMAEARRARRRPRSLWPGRPLASTRAVSAADVQIAEANPSHRRALLAFLRELSPHTAYNRFVTPAPPANVVDVHVMLANDACHRTVLALRGEEIVGHAHAVASPDRDPVELGLVIADEWQGMGVGPRLVRALLESGPAAAADELEFFVLAWNTRARRMIKHLWPDAIADRDGELIHYRVRRAPTSTRTVLTPAVTAVRCRT